MPEDEIYTINQYLEVFRLDEYEDPDIEGEENHPARDFRSFDRYSL